MQLWFRRYRPCCILRVLMTDVACEKYVLLVEDDLDIREVLVDILSDWGYQVVAVNDGRAALDALARRQPPPCVALVDLMMPVMDGIELVSRMRADITLSRIPVVITSATPTSAPGGVAAVFAKPLDLDRLHDAVRTLCG